MLKIALHAYSSSEHLELQERLTQLVMDCQGWVLEDEASSSAAYRLRFEVGLEKIADIYGALQQAGLQLTPTAHRALTEMCLCQKHLPKGEDMQIVSVDLRVGTLDDEHVRFQRFVPQNIV